MTLNVVKTTVFFSAHKGNHPFFFVLVTDRETERNNTTSETGVKTVVQLYVSYIITIYVRKLLKVAELTEL